MKMTTTCWAMIGNLFDIIIVAATDKDLSEQIVKSLKVLETVVRLLNDLVTI